MITTIAWMVCAAGSVRIEVPPAATVRGVELSLGAVATVSGDDPAAVEAARGARLGYAPAPGYTRTLERWQLAQELERALPGARIEITGAETCLVRPQVEVLAAERVLAAARAELERSFAAWDATLAPSAPLHPLEVPSGERGIELRARPARVDPSAAVVSMPVDVLVDGELYRTLWTSWSVGVWSEVPVLARDVRRGEELTPAAFRSERLKIDLATQRGHLSEASAGGAVALRDLREGNVVLERDVARPMLVTRGRTVQLRVVKGGVTATVLAVARQDGRMGDEIAVVTDSKKEIRAVILGQDLVGLQLAGNP